MALLAKLASPGFSAFTLCSSGDKLPLIRVEGKNIFLWLALALAAYFVWSICFGGLFGLFGGLYIAGPLAVESSSTEAINGGQVLSAKQAEFLKLETVKRMKQVNWWLWWPLLNAIAWAVTGAFLGFARMFRYNLLLLLLFYIPWLFVKGDDWAPPGSLTIEGTTLLTSAVVLWCSSKWVYSIRIRT